MRTLVLGGNGFIGSHIVDACTQAGFDVRVLARDRYRYDSSVLSFIGDAFEEADLSNACAGGLDVVVHCADSATPSTADSDPFPYESLKGALSLVDALSAGNIEHLVYISSGGAVYGDVGSEPASENLPCEPLSVYGARKLAAETYLRVLCAKRNVTLTILRPSNPFGGRQEFKNGQGLLPLLIHKAIHDEVLDLYDFGESIRDFIHIDDVADAVVKVMQQHAAGVFNVSYGKGVKVLDLVDVVEQEFEHKFVKRFHPRRDFDVPSIVLDNRKLSLRCGWRPKIGFRRGLKRYLSEVRSTRWLRK